MFLFVEKSDAGFNGNADLFDVGLNRKLDRKIFAIFPAIELKGKGSFDVLMVGRNHSDFSSFEQLQTHYLSIHCQPAVQKDLGLASNSKGFCSIEVSHLKLVLLLLEFLLEGFCVISKSSNNCSILQFLSV